MEASSKTKITVSAVVTRADGTVEDLGVIGELVQETEEAEQPVVTLSEEEVLKED